MSSSPLKRKYAKTGYRTNKRNSLLKNEMARTSKMVTTLIAMSPSAFFDSRLLFLRSLCCGRSSDGPTDVDLSSTSIILSVVGCNMVSSVSNWLFEIISSPAKQQEVSELLAKAPLAFC